jgi:hypothetical protein
MLNTLTKPQVCKIVREVATKNGSNLTREEKQQVFNQVVDGLFSEGKISKKQQISWTHPF